MTMACISVTTDSNDRIINYIGDETTELVEGIAMHVVSWVRQTQVCFNSESFMQTFKEVSWPEVGIEAAKRKLGFDPIEVSSYNESANMVQKGFEIRGSERCFFKRRNTHQMML